MIKCLYLFLTREKQKSGRKKPPNMTRKTPTIFMDNVKYDSVSFFVKIIREETIVFLYVLIF